MTRGAVLFAFNSPTYDYYAMAEHTAKRINHFLNLPVTLITDDKSVKSNTGYTFDNLIKIKPDTSNKRDWGVWINKGRYQAYELSPYDETLLLDVDYMVNSNKLSQCFDIYDDFCCHDNTAYYMYPEAEQEILSSYSFKTLWATAVVFKKTNRVKQIFECMKMIQNNFHHYSNIHKFIPSIFRNDYALTLALRIVNGHVVLKRDIIPWNLIHIAKSTPIYANTTDEFNTEFTILINNFKKGKVRKEYLTIKDTDFHIMNKDNYSELISHG